MKRNVDVLIGGQYGSEGKGNICSRIAYKYDILVRTGGPNAGHCVLTESGKKLVFHHLPSGSYHNKNARLVLGPGAVIHVPTLLREIEATETDPSRITIDPQAVIIDEEDRMDEARSDGLVSRIGSTGQGVGYATKRKVERQVFGTFLAGDHEYLKDFVTSTLPIFNSNPNSRILVEGTQGTLLSLHHGAWPYVTSRDTTASGMLSEAGIPPTRVNRVLMVCRTFPIRVQSPEGGTSGPLPREITWDDVARISQNVALSGDLLRESERTTTTKRLRRVAEFDTDDFRRACLLNAPTDLALTFADYLPQSRRMELAHHMAHVSNANMSFISMGPRPDDVMWANEKDW